MTLTAPNSAPVDTGRLSSGASRWAWVDRSYAVLLIFALTQGPVLSIWLRTAQLGQVPPERAIDPTYLLVHLPAIALLGRRLKAGVLARRPTTAVVALVGYLAATTLWSMLRADTAISVIALLCTTAAGLYLALSFPIRRLVTITWLAMQPGLLLSELAVRHKWFDAVDYGKNWAGIYFNRNSLGPVAAIGLLTAVLLGAGSLRRPGGRHRTAMLVACAATAAYDARMLVRSGSATSFALLAVAGAVYAVTTLLARRYGPSCTVTAARRLGGLAIGFLGAAAIAAWALRDQVSRLLHRPPGFDGRTIYWEASLRGVRERPLRGWGWLAAWRTPAFKTLVPDVLKNEVWTHNAYLDIALGGGIIAVLLLAVMLVVGFGNAVEIAVGDSEMSAWPLALATAVVVASTQESFLIGNHFLWLLFVVAMTTLAVPRRSRTGSEET